MKNVSCQLTMFLVSIDRAFRSDLLLLDLLHRYWRAFVFSRSFKLFHTFTSTVTALLKLTNERFNSANSCFVMRYLQNSWKHCHFGKNNYTTYTCIQGWYLWHSHQPINIRYFDFFFFSCQIINLIISLSKFISYFHWFYRLFLTFATKKFPSGVF